MRQASRLKAFPYILIAAVLAVALPFNSFAASDTVYISNDFAFNILGSSHFPYFSYFGVNVNGEYEELIGDFGSVSGNSFSFRYLSMSRSNFADFENMVLLVYIPLFMLDLTSVDFNLFYGLVSSDGMLYDELTLQSVFISGNDLFISPSLLVNDYTYDFTSSDGNSSYTLKSANINYSSSSFFDSTSMTLVFHLNDISSSMSDILRFYIGVSNSSSVSTPSSNVASITQSLSLLAQLMDTVIAQQNLSNSQILSYLDDILYAIQSGGSSSDSEITGPPSEESEDILDEGAIKQEQLEELGQALGDVPKPSIQDVSQLIDPNVSLSTSSPQMVQTALNIVYSWDKFLAILALVIALGTISYILFGKKS